MVSLISGLENDRHGRQRPLPDWVDGVQGGELDVRGPAELRDVNRCLIGVGFVAQVADVVGGRVAKIHDAEYRKLAARTIKGEFSEVRGWIVFFLIGTTGRVESRWCRGLYGRD